MNLAGDPDIFAKIQDMSLDRPKCVKWHFAVYPS